MLGERDTADAAGDGGGGGCVRESGFATPPRTAVHVLDWDDPDRRRSVSPAASVSTGGTESPMELSSDSGSDEWSPARVHAQRVAERRLNAGDVALSQFEHAARDPFVLLPRSFGSGEAYASPEFSTVRPSRARSAAGVAGSVAQRAAAKAAASPGALPAGGHASVSAILGSPVGRTPPRALGGRRDDALSRLVSRRLLEASDSASPSARLEAQAALLPLRASLQQVQLAQARAASRAAPPGSPGSPDSGATSGRAALAGLPTAKSALGRLGQLRSAFDESEARTARLRAQVMHDGQLTEDKLALLRAESHGWTAKHAMLSASRLHGGDESSDGGESAAGSSYSYASPARVRLERMRAQLSRMAE